MAYEGEWRDDAFEGRGTIFNEMTGNKEGEEVNYKDLGQKKIVNYGTVIVESFKSIKKMGLEH